MILTWLRAQRDEVELAYIRAVARGDRRNQLLLSEKLCNLIDEIARLESYTDCKSSGCTEKKVDGDYCPHCTWLRTAGCPVCAVVEPCEHRS